MLFSHSLEVRASRGKARPLLRDRSAQGGRAAGAGTWAARPGARAPRRAAPRRAASRCYHFSQRVMRCRWARPVRRLKLPLMLAAAMLAPAAALAVTDADRVAVYREFRAAFDAHRYPDALPLAEKLVALTQEQYGANARELVNPLSNLGTTDYRIGEYTDAEDTSLRSVKMPACTGGPPAGLLLRPLPGLATNYYAPGPRVDASVPL